MLRSLCRVACKGGVLKTCYSRETLLLEANKAPELYGLQGLVDTWRELPQVSVREALKHISPTGGQGMLKCEYEKKVLSRVEQK